MRADHRLLLAPRVVCIDLANRDLREWRTQQELRHVRIRFQGFVQACLAGAVVAPVPEGEQCVAVEQAGGAFGLVLVEEFPGQHLLAHVEIPGEEQIAQTEGVVPVDLEATVR
jgi:hypothetical protein